MLTVAKLSGCMSDFEVIGVAQCLSASLKWVEHAAFIMRGSTYSRLCLFDVQLSFVRHKRGATCQTQLL